MTPASPRLVVPGDWRKSAAPLAVLSLMLVGQAVLAIWIAAPDADRSVAPVGLLLSDPIGTTVAAVYVLIFLMLAWMAWLMARRILMRPTLTLTQEGLAIRDQLGTAFVAWRDIEAFEIAYDANTSRKYVGWRLIPQARPPDRWFPRTGGALDGNVGMGWRGSVAELRETLEEWRVRFGETR